MVTIAERNVPTMLPTVESAYRRPATAPASRTSTSASRMAKGATAPSSVIGTAKRASAAKKEPTTAPTETASRPRRATSRIGRAMNGVSATAPAATRMIQPRKRGSGRRSASFPPSQ